MKVLIAAAGTGGHINPGIAIANKIKKENPQAEITFVGTKNGLENTLVPKAGYKLYTIEAYGFSRKITFNNFTKMIKTIKSTKTAKQFIEEYRPDIVIGTGGYICGPVFLSATKLKIPTILHESNAFPGVAVKLLSKKVDEVLVSFEDAKKRLKKAKKVVVTGTPTNIKNLKLPEEEKNKVKKNLGIRLDLPLILVFGGSQGAKSINESLLEIFKQKLNSNYQIIFATGPKQYDDYKVELSKNGLNIDYILNTKIVPYIYNMEEIMNVSDLIICRSGAMTVTEISLLGKPAIFIPFPFATENHQEYNAKVLENIDAAKIILDKDLTAQKLSDTINNIINDKNILDKMSKNSESIAIKNTEDVIYKEIIKCLK